jgi:hypothetical protein
MVGETERLASLRQVLKFRSVAAFEFCEFGQKSEDAVTRISDELRVSTREKLVAHTRARQLADRVTDLAVTDGLIRVPAHVVGEDLGGGVAVLYADVAQLTFLGRQRRRGASCA